jgi:hypothetical protein
MAKQIKSGGLSIRGSRVAEFTAEQRPFDLSMDDSTSMETALDFWLALILVFVAAAFLDIAAVIF